MEDGRWGNTMTGVSGHGLRMERCLLNKEEVLLPEAFVDQTNIFQHVMSQETWDNVLSEEQRRHLETFLPDFPKDIDAEEKKDTARRLFRGENFKFGNPLMQFHQKLKDGYLSPDIAKYSRLCRKFKYREYKFSQQQYFSEILKEILISRQCALGQINGLPPDQPLKFHHSPRKECHKGIDYRVNKNYLRILKEAREECGLDDTSSDEEDNISPVQRSRRQLFKSLGPIPSPEPTTPSVVATFASKPSTLNGDLSGASSKRPRAISPVEIQEEDYRAMLKNHKRKKQQSPELPELETQHVTLQDILVRCQANKKVSKSPTSASNGEPSHDVTTVSTPQSKKKQRVREKGEHKMKKKLKTEKCGESTDIADVGLSLPSNSSALDVHTPLLTHRDEDGVPDFPLPDTLPSRLTMGQADSFFSLLRDIICDFTDSKATTAKLEERVREWQDSPASTLNSWLHQQDNWVDCVVSALKFLSGDVLGLSMENFVPFLDYKERAQQWKWIGAGRDSNQHLAPLFYHWMKYKDAVSLDGLGAGQGSPPPVKMKTNFVVRPTTNAEKAAFQEQEARRFENPHRAFTYQLHGYDSVVGPVKGVYNKESAMTKAREHALLVSERPAYVTILTLVRDAAARLPNGEGTRGDICELLKDSQFLAPGVTDTQINTVVSGALDRLHSEKDPCVKYDVNSKLWIYLHRSRTEDEFERIHQAQGAAVKAKKSLQRPKASKAIKDQVASQTALASAAKPAPTASSPGTPSAGDLKLKDLTSLVSQPVRQLSTSLSETPFAQVRGAKSAGKQGGTAAAQKAAAAAIAAASTQAAAAAIATTSAQPANSVGQVAATASGPQVSTISISSSASNTRAVTQPPKMQQAVSGAAPPMAKPRMPTMTLSQAAASSMLATKSQTVGVLQGQQAVSHNSSLLASIGKPATGGVTKPPVVTVTKQGLASVSRQISLSEAQPETPVGAAGKSTTTRGSPIILTQEVPSQTSSPAMALPSTAKVMTLAQSGTAGVASSAGGAGDSSVVTRLVQQQVVSVGSLLASGQARSLTQTLGQPRSTTLKIQGGSIVQPLVGGSPVQLTGKPLATAKGLLQLGGKGGQPLGVIQTTHGQISTLSLIPQALATSTTTTGTGGSGGKLTMSASSGTRSPVTLTMVGSPAPGNNMQSKATVLTHVSSPGTGTAGQARVVSPSQAGVVVTQFTPGGSIALRPGASQAKVMTGQAAGLVPAQFIVQQAAGGGTTQAGTQGTPIIVSQAGGKGGQQNIQVVRTVLSQQGALKPGQATILISQPALHQAAAAGTVLSSGQVIHASSSAASGKTTGRGSPKGKTQPVYARIITPPAGMKLTTVSPSQVAAGGNVLQTVGKILAGLPNTVTAGGGSTGQQNIGTVTISAATALPSVAVTVTQAHAASLQSLVRTQMAEGGGSGTEPGTN